MSATAYRLVAGEPFKEAVAMAKLHSSTVTVDNARDSEIGEGTSEVQRMLIARELGLPG